MGNAVLGIALGAPDIVGGFKKAGKDIKAQRGKPNKYDEALGNEPVPPNVNAMPKIAELIDALFEKQAEKDKSFGDYAKVYALPTAVVGASLIRGKQTGNYMHFLKNDTTEFAKKVAPKLVDKILAGAGKKSRGAAAVGFEAATRINQTAMKDKNGYKTLIDAALMGAGMTGGGLLVERAANKNNFTKTASIEVPKTARNYVKKLVREGVLQPSISSVPIYATPVAVGYALNKDIRNDFGPVRNLSEADQKKNKGKRNTSQTSLGSRNNAMLNNEFMKSAGVKERLGRMATAMAEKKTARIAREATLPKMKIKGWHEYLKEDMPIAGLRATSMAVPLTLLATADPVQKMKMKSMEAEMTAQNRAAERQQKRELKKVVKQEVSKAVSDGF